MKARVKQSSLFHPISKAVREWNALTSPHLYFGIALACLAICLILWKPRLTWPFLMVTMPLADPIKVDGYCIVDEILVAVIGVTLLVQRARSRKTAHTPLRTGSGVHVICFGSLMMYMVLESVRGIAHSGDIRLLRFVLYFSFLWLLSTMLRRPNIEVPPVSRSAFLLTTGVVLSLGTYLAYGMIAEATFGTNRWAFQDLNTWAGSAVATFPAPLGLMSGIICLRLASSMRQRLLGYLVLVLVAVVAQYFDSRFALMSAFIIMVIVLFSRDISAVKRFMLATCMLAALVAATAIRHDTVSYGVQNNIDDLEGVFLAPFMPSEYDPGRNSELYAAIRTVTSDPVLLLVGGGTYAHKDLMSAARGDILGELQPTRSMYSNTFQGSTGIAALLVDGGLIGVILFYLNVVLAIRAVRRAGRGPENKFKTNLMCSTMIILAASPIVANVLDVSLLYLSFMPAGLMTCFICRRGGPYGRMPLLSYVSAADAGMPGRGFRYPSAKRSRTELRPLR